MPRTEGGMTYRRETTLHGENYEEPVDRGSFSQITRLERGLSRCLYCLSEDVPPDASETYGPLMARLSPNGANQPLDFTDHRLEIVEAAAEWRRASRARDKAQNPERRQVIEEAMSRRFATAVVCDGCADIGDTELRKPNREK